MADLLDQLGLTPDQLLTKIRPLRLLGRAPEFRTRKAKLRDLGCTSYAQWLNRPGERKKLRERLGDPSGCMTCPWATPESVQPHHVVYDRLGSEHPDDLQPLCDFCHKE